MSINTALPYLRTHTRKPQVQLIQEYRVPLTASSCVYVHNQQLLLDPIKPVWLLPPGYLPTQTMTDWLPMRLRTDTASHCSSGCCVHCYGQSDVHSEDFGILGRAAECEAAKMPSWLFMRQ